jgi:hypothetical protein
MNSFPFQFSYTNIRNASVAIRAASRVHEKLPARIRAATARWKCKTQRRFYGAE